MSKKQIEECVRASLEGYFKDLRGVEPSNLYEMILGVGAMTKHEAESKKELERLHARIGRHEGLKLVELAVHASIFANLQKFVNMPTKK